VTKLRDVPPVPPRAPDTTGPTLVLRENWQQFTLLVLVNTFVVAMVGLGGSVFPLIGEREFGPVRTARGQGSVQGGG